MALSVRLMSLLYFVFVWYQASNVLYGLLLFYTFSVLTLQDNTAEAKPKADAINAVR